MIVRDSSPNDAGPLSRPTAEGESRTDATWRLSSAVAAGGSAIATIDLSTADEATLDTTLHRLTGRTPPGVGEIVLRRFGTADDGLVVRIDARRAVLMPHGGAAVLRAVGDALDRAGARRSRSRSFDPLESYPEAASLFDACLLDALATVESEIGLDALLRQEELWRSVDGRSWNHDAAAVARRADSMRTLLHAPLIAAVGPANVGKSTLTNALAQRSVAIVADLPGTTRDHVGVTLELGGLTVRWVDTPGVLRHDTTDFDADALALVRPVIGSAAAIVSCGDHESGFLSETELAQLGVTDGTPIVHCLMRTDAALADETRAHKSVVESNAHDAAGGEHRPAPTVLTAALHRRGLTELAAAVREAVVSREIVERDEPWLFHPALAEALAAGHDPFAARG